MLESGILNVRNVTYTGIQLAELEEKYLQNFNLTIYLSSFSQAQSWMKLPL